ncbi:MAG: excinuclease ABC subunit C [Candidatus Azobacteroides sp.]|nr:excinuclease ABC subunit C [Candidatus Azobacteroides sp.]
MTKKYNCDKLVFYEEYSNIEEAIAREKQLKSWEREWKNISVEKINPTQEDLSLKWDYKDGNC